MEIARIVIGTVFACGMLLFIFASILSIGATRKYRQVDAIVDTFIYLVAGTSVAMLLIR